MAKRGGKKGRSIRTYENKVRRIRAWYNHIAKIHQNKDGLGKPKKPLKPLDYFLDKLKKAT